MGSFDRIFLSIYNRENNISLSGVSDESDLSSGRKDRVVKERLDSLDDSMERNESGSVIVEEDSSYPETIPIRPFGRAAREQITYRTDAANSFRPHSHLGIKEIKNNGSNGSFKVVERKETDADEESNCSSLYCREDHPQQETATIIPLTQYCDPMEEELTPLANHTGILLGDFPFFLRDLPKEAERELYGLGEYLYEKLLEGHKVLGFMGTKKAVGCSTLILAVAGEILRKGLSLLIVDTHKNGSDILSFLDHPDQISLPETSDLCKKILKISIPAIGEAQMGSGQWKQDDLYSGPFLYFLQGSSLLSSERSDGEGDLSGDPASKIRSLADDFDLVLVDSGSCEDLSDEEILHNILKIGEDGFFIVRDVREKENFRIRELSDKSREVQIPCLGIVENFV